MYFVKLVSVKYNKTLKALLLLWYEIYSSWPEPCDRYSTLLHLVLYLPLDSHLKLYISYKVYSAGNSQHHEYSSHTILHVKACFQKLAPSSRLNNTPPVNKDTGKPLLLHTLTNRCTKCCSHTCCCPSSHKVSLLCVSTELLKHWGTLLP